MAAEYEKLCQQLGYRFNDLSLLGKALTHRSVSQDNYERLEFLGDALLSLIIAEALFDRFPERKEGEMSRIRANLVMGKTLAIIAREFQLGDYLKLGGGELKSGGFNRDSILADAFESVLGAMFLDSNYEVCKKCVLSWYQERLEDPDIFVDMKDAKTRLQEYVQARKMALPDYEVVKLEGEPHEQVFTVSCNVQGMTYVTQASDTTRRCAEQKTAQDYLLWLEQQDE